MISLDDEDRQQHAGAAADERRDARDAQHLCWRRRRIDDALVEILRQRRRQHEQDRFARADFGGKHRRQRQRAEPHRQAVQQQRRQHLDRALRCPGTARARRGRETPAGTRRSSARSHSRRRRIRTARGALGAVGLLDQARRHDEVRARQQQQREAGSGARQKTADRRRSSGSAGVCAIASNPPAAFIRIGIAIAKPVNFTIS